VQFVYRFKTFWRWPDGDIARPKHAAFWYCIEIVVFGGHVLIYIYISTCRLVRPDTSRVYADRKESLSLCWPSAAQNVKLRICFALLWSFGHVSLESGRTLGRFSHGHRIVTLHSAKWHANKIEYFSNMYHSASLQGGDRFSSVSFLSRNIAPAT